MSQYSPFEFPYQLDGWTKATGVCNNSSLLYRIRSVYFKHGFPPHKLPRIPEELLSILKHALMIFYHLFGRYLRLGLGTLGVLDKEKSFWLTTSGPVSHGLVSGWEYHRKAIHRSRLGSSVVPYRRVEFPRGEKKNITISIFGQVRSDSELDGDFQAVGLNKSLRTSFVEIPWLAGGSAVRNKWLQESEVLGLADGKRAEAGPLAIGAV